MGDHTPGASLALAKEHATIVWASYNMMLEGGNSSAEAFHEVITTFATLAELDASSLHKSIEQIVAGPPPDSFRRWCGNCKVLDHCEQQCPRLYSGLGFDKLIKSKPTLDEIQFGQICIAYSRPPCPSPDYCYMCCKPNHTDFNCSKRKSLLRRMKRQNEANPSEQTIEAEKRLRAPQGEKQHSNKATQTEIDSLREMQRRPEPGFYEKKNQEEWIEVVRPKICDFCNRIGHLEQNCRSKRTEDERKRTAEEKQRRRNKFNPRNIPCSACGRIGHIVDSCWIAHPELRRQQASPFFGFNNRAIRFFDITTKDWNHHMVSNMAKGDFIHFWLTTRAREKYIHPGAEYKYSFSGSCAIDNEILKRNDYRHAFDVAKAEENIEQAIAIQRDFIKSWGPVDNGYLENNAKFVDQTVSKVERSRRTSAIMRNYQPNFCDHCHKSGHIEEDCWTKYPILKPDGSWRNPEFENSFDPEMRIIGIRCKECNWIHRHDPECSGIPLKLFNYMLANTMNGRGISTFRREMPAKNVRGLKSSWSV